MTKVRVVWIAVTAAWGGWFGSTLCGQTQWTKHPGNPVIKTPPACCLAWDGGDIGALSVVLDGDTYRMWYLGGTDPKKKSVGYATSPDGITWTKHSCNPVMETPSVCCLAWDGGDIGGLSVGLDVDTYRMW